MCSKVIEILIFSVLFIVYWNKEQVRCGGGSKKNVSDVVTEAKLIFSHVIFRHGERNPAHQYPTDKYNDPKYWKGGVGDLIDEGKQRLFELGKYLRRRYRNLLKNRTYSPDLIYVQSSDVPRTWESAVAAMAGFFGHKKWNDTIHSIPIEKIPKEKDNLLQFSGVPCPRYKELKKKLFNSDEFKAKWKDNSKLFKLLQKHTNMTVKQFRDVNTLHDILFVEDSKELPLPDWAKDVFYSGDMERAAQYFFECNSNTKPMARLRSGFLIREMLDRFSAESQSKLSPDYSFWVYSGHDSTIFALLNTLKVVKMKLVPFGACILFELYKPAKGDYYLQLFYKTRSAEDIKPLEIPNCGTKCPLKEFYTIYDEVIPTQDFETECQTETAK